MKKILTVLAMSFSALLSSNFATAAPQFDRDSADHPRNQAHNKREFRGDSEERMLDKRRMREERGVKRLQQHKWQTGYVMPQHYRGNGYKVDYKDHSLPKPARNQQWYKINNDYILIDSGSNDILRIVND